MLPKIVIFGHSNVGKSTLFNRIAKRRAAIVENISRVTRDSVSLEIMRDDLKFILYDSAGFFDLNPKEILDKDILNNLNFIIKNADLVIFLLDARAGVLPIDFSCANFLRKYSSKVILIANKAESVIHEKFTHEVFGLGLGNALNISATHGLGLKLLEEKIIEKIKSLPKINSNICGKKSIPDDTYRLAIVGRPNSGKSTLFNRIIGKKRVLTSSNPGTTRDSVTDSVFWNNNNIHLIDTAGIRKGSKIDNKIEEKSVSSSLNSIRYAQIVVLVVDSSKGFSKQDMSIASHVVKEGRALVIAANKWDLIENKIEIRKNFQYKLDVALSQLKNVKLIEISALSGKGVESLLLAVFSIYKKWNIKIETAKLNNWLGNIQERNPPPLKSGKAVKMKYCTQINIRPPTFVFFTNLDKAISKNYQRYILNSLRESFGLEGVPLRIIFRKKKNPYSKA